MKKAYFGLVFCMALFCALCALARQEAQGQAVAEKVLRLHVLAASDAPEDQARKLLVRDAILAELTPLLSDCDDAASAAALTATQLDSLSQAAEEALRAQGTPQTVTVTLRREHFDTRAYTGFALPAGTYVALRASIGPGQGHNWWCVVFPPLCLSAAGQEDDAFAVFSDEEKALLTTQGRVVRFKLLEWLEALRTQLAEVF